jgi:hypothetical protein
MAAVSPPARSFILECHYNLKGTRVRAVTLIATIDLKSAGIDWKSVQRVADRSLRCTRQKEEREP